MNRRAQIGRLLQRYGDLVEIRGEERALQVNAWIQPLRYKNKMYLGGTYLPVWFANEILYIWAILQICGEENL